MSSGCQSCLNGVHPPAISAGEDEAQIGVAVCDLIERLDQQIDLFSWLEGTHEEREGFVPELGDDLFVRHCARFVEPRVIDAVRDDRDRSMLGKARRDAVRSVL